VGAKIGAAVATGAWVAGVAVATGALVAGVAVDTGAPVLVAGATVGARVGDRLGAAVGALVDRDRFRKEPKNRPNGFQTVFHTLRVEDFVVGVMAAAALVVDDSPRTEVPVFAS
jgi:hypothetical protein